MVIFGFLRCGRDVSTGRRECVGGQPVGETGGGQGGRGAGDERVVVEHHAEIGGLGFGDNATGVVIRTEANPDEFVERVAIGAGDFVDAADGLADGGAGDRGGDVV